MHIAIASLRMDIEMGMLNGSDKTDRLNAVLIDVQDRVITEAPNNDITAPYSRSFPKIFLDMIIARNMLFFFVVNCTAIRLHVCYIKILSYDWINYLNIYGMLYVYSVSQYQL